MEQTWRKQMAQFQDADFRSKLSISYKEALETKYWLDVLNRAGFSSDDNQKQLIMAADELAAMLFSTIRSINLKLNK